MKQSYRRNEETKALTSIIGWISYIEEETSTESQREVYERLEYLPSIMQ